MRSFRFARTVLLPGSPERVWPLLAQTDLLNRETGLPIPDFTFRPRPEGGTDAEGEVVLGPLRMRYEEHPFEWVRPRYYSVHRVFHSGPFRSVGGRVEFDPEGASTAVTTHVEIDAPGSAAPLARAFARRSFRMFTETCAGFERHLRLPEAPAYPKESARPAVDSARLLLGQSELRAQGFGAEVGVLTRFLAEAPAGETTLFRPARLGLPDRRHALRLCLAATRVGLLDLSWRVMCPYCRSNREVVADLGALRREVHCASCAIAFDAEFDLNVEVLFSVAFPVRPVVRAAYCIGGPHLAPHVVAQFVLGPGETREPKVVPPSGRYRLVSLQAPNQVSVDCEEGLEVCLDDAGLSAEPAHRWRIRNGRKSTVILRVEALDAASEVVTAAEVTTMTDFRDQFSGEVLAPGVELAVRQVALLFTDLRGSTRMYRDLGDAPSYAEVRRHFALVGEIVAAHGGGVVKTIGDAVMAAFHDPADAVRAALEIQRREQGLAVRIGVHAGPAIVVNANERLDYFGRTVNLASRLEKHSHGGDVVIAESLLTDPRIRELAEAVPHEPFRANVPGVDEAMPLLRLRY